MTKGEIQPPGLPETLILPDDKTIVTMLTELAGLVRGYGTNLIARGAPQQEQIRVSGRSVGEPGTMGRICVPISDVNSITVFAVKQPGDPYAHIWTSARITWGTIPPVITPIYEDARPFSPEQKSLIIAALFEFVHSEKAVEVQYEGKRNNGKWKGIGPKIAVEYPFTQLVSHLKSDIT